MSQIVKAEFYGVPHDDKGKRGSVMESDEEAQKEYDNCPELQEP
jgi:hypothetical protein